MISLKATADYSMHSWDLQANWAHTPALALREQVWLGGSDYEYFRIANTALCPPKPKALVSAKLIFFSRASLGI